MCRLMVVILCCVSLLCLLNPRHAGAQIAPAFFGMHMTGGVTGAEPWPVDSFAAVRLWDSNTPWSQLNPKKGVYNWTILDIWMNHAPDHRIDLLYTFGRVPQWASSNPTDTNCATEPGSCDPPNDLNPDGSGTNQHWKDFVTAIAKRSAGRIHYWEMWNEAPNPMRWTGTNAQMIRMVSDARKIIRSIDSTAVILSPSGAVRYTSALDWWSSYLADGGGQYADIFAIHGYVQPGTGLPVPERLASFVSTFNNILKQNNQTGKPIWDTEGSWGGTLATGMKDMDMQAGFVTRFYLIHQSIGISRFYWYEWENDFTGTLWSFNTQVDLAVGTLGGSNLTTLLGWGDGTFRPPVNYGVANTPSAIAIGDFNGDSKLDVVVANQGSNNVSILRGNGDATFQNAISYGTGHAPMAVAVADLNGDGKLDLVIANQTDNNLSVLSGNGDGTFQGAVNFGTGTAPRSIAVGDLNGDGKLDLIVVNQGSNNISVLLGKGDGTFAAASNFAVGTSPYAVVTAKFNSDAYLDVAVANRGSNNVSILLGNGNGTLRAAVNYAVGSNPSALAVGYFNGSAPNVADLAVANYGSNNVSILMGYGNGVFQPAVNYAAGTNPSAIAVGIFNADLHTGLGRPGLAVTNAGSNNVSILLPSGQGVFQPAMNFPVGSSPTSLAVGAFSLVGSNDPGTLLKPGAAYQAAYNWMVGASMSPG